MDGFKFRVLESGVEVVQCQVVSVKELVVQQGRMIVEFLRQILCFALRSLRWGLNSGRRARYYLSTEACERERIALLSVCLREAVAVSGLELKSGWPKVRAAV